jgi:hypothetical protein
MGRIGPMGRMGIGDRTREKGGIGSHILMCPIGPIRPISAHLVASRLFR